MGVFVRAEIPTFFADLSYARQMIVFFARKRESFFGGLFFSRVSAGKKMVFLVFWVFFGVFFGVFVLLGKGHSKKRERHHAENLPALATYLPTSASARTTPARCAHDRKTLQVPQNGCFWLQMATKQGGTEIFW